MKRTGGLLVLAAVCTTAACQLVAGIQDRVLFTADDASTASSSGSSSTKGTPGPEGSVSEGSGNDDGSGTTDVPGDASGSSVDVSSGDTAAPTDSSSPPLDAGSPVDTGSPVDAFVDAGSLVDASSVDGAFGTPCARQTGFIFCDDFDSVTDATTGWTWTAFGVDAASLQLAQNAPATPPNDLAVVIPAVAGNSSIGKQLGTIGDFTLAFDLRLDQDSLDDLPYVIVAQVIVAQPDGGGDTFNYSLGSGASRALQVFVNGEQSYFALPVPPTRQWMHVTIAYSADAGVVTTQDGVSIGGGAIASSPGQGTLAVGDVYDNGVNPGTLSYSIDDIVIQGTAP